MGYAMQNQSENEGALMSQMTRMNVSQAPNQQPFDMSGMMRDMAGMQFQMNREENVAKQMQQMTVNQPGFNMTSVNNAFGSLQLDSQPDMEVPPNISYTDYMIERVSIEDTSINNPSFLSAIATNVIKNNNNIQGTYYAR